MTTKNTTRKSKTNSETQPAPVAKEFVETLLETAETTLREYLEKTNAPQGVRDVAMSVSNLWFYLSKVDTYPAEEWSVKKFDIQGTITDAANAIAEAGGQFCGPASLSARREV